MSSSITNSAEFSTEQKEYLKGFFAGIAGRGFTLPFVGHTADGLITADPKSQAINQADTEPTWFGTPASELSREELWKYEQNPLDIWDKILQYSNQDRFPNDEDRFRLKYFGLFHVAPAQDSFMLRLRMPGGVLNSHQMRGLACIAEQYGLGRADLTTRSNMQLRGFAPRHIVSVLQEIQALGLTSKGTGADNIRNITASPISGLDPLELIDVSPLAQAMQSYITNTRVMYDLPRKFNIAFDNGGTISTLADTNDIGFLAVRVPEGRSIPAGIYFRVMLCGITGHRQFASDCGLLLRPEETVAVAAAMIRVFVQHGDRSNRKTARLKYLLDQWGVERFLEGTQKVLAFPLIRVPLDECEPRRAINRKAHLGTHQQSQLGLYYVGISVPVGHLRADKMRAIAGIAERFGTGQLRLTVWQNLIIPNIAQKDLEGVIQALHKAGLSETAGTVLSGTVACTGNKGCRFAAADTKSHAVALANHLDERFPMIDQPVNLHVTGCSHSCAQHYIGDIGLMGVKVGGEEGYQVVIGGGSDSDQEVARELISAARFTDLSPKLDALFHAYTIRRNADESFLEFTRRHDIRTLQHLCEQEQA
ncbi:NirA family protein [Edaphobacter sp. HDX4]|uniref:NirA family protein n=1 Tax=Edaphobacter sp. HDX4 TaxID=2794064 RepID=UPI002FE57161